MTKAARLFIVTLCAGFAWLGLSRSTAGVRTAKLDVVIVQGAGPVTGQDPAKHADAITHATPQDINTYVFSAELAKHLDLLNAETHIIDFLQCQNLECLQPRPTAGGNRKVDILVFAGPAHFSQLPSPLRDLFPKLRGIASATPDLVCSSLIAAWYPDTKGVQAAKQVDRAFAAAGLRTVMGVSLLTPRKTNPGITREAMDKALTDFAAQLVATARTRATTRED